MWCNMSQLSDFLSVSVFLIKMFPWSKFTFVTNGRCLNWVWVELPSVFTVTTSQWGYLDRLSLDLQAAKAERWALSTREKENAAKISHEVALRETCGFETLPVLLTEGQSILARAHQPAFKFHACVCFLHGSVVKCLSAFLFQYYPNVQQPF